MVLYSGMWPHAGLWDFKGVSEGLTTAILRIEEQAKQVYNKNQEAYV
jgi:hypothetical protein